jgi:hypothetical protein
MSATGTLPATHVQRSDTICGACHVEFPTLLDVFTHPCDAVEAQRSYRRLVGLPAERSLPTGGTGQAVRREHQPHPKCEAHDRYLDPDGTCFDCTLEVQQANPKPAGDHKPNRYAGTCGLCGAWVEAEAGKLGPKVAGKWTVQHVEPCPAVEAQPAPVAPAAPQAATEARPAVTPGMYLVGEAIYKVQAARGTKNLYAKVLVEDGDGFRFDYEAGAIVRVRAEGVRMTVDEAKAFGQRTGTCCVCAALLTDPKSIAAGIGPICGGRV